MTVVSRLIDDRLFVPVRRLARGGVVAVALLWIVGVVFIAGALIGPIRTQWVDIPALTGARRAILFLLGVTALALGGGLFLVDAGYLRHGPGVAEAGQRVGGRRRR